MILLPLCQNASGVKGILPTRSSLHYWIHLKCLLDNEPWGLFPCSKVSIADWKQTHTIQAFLWKREGKGLKSLTDKNNPARPRLTSLPLHKTSATASRAPSCWHVFSTLETRQLHQERPTRCEVSTDSHLASGMETGPPRQRWLYTHDSRYPRFPVTLLGKASCLPISRTVLKFLFNLPLDVSGPGWWCCMSINIISATGQVIIQQLSWAELPDRTQAAGLWKMPGGAFQPTPKLEYAHPHHDRLTPLRLSCFTTGKEPNRNNHTTMMSQCLWPLSPFTDLHCAPRHATGQAAALEPSTILQK